MLDMALCDVLLLEDIDRRSMECRLYAVRVDLDNIIHQRKHITGSIASHRGNHPSFRSSRSCRRLIASLDVFHPVCSRPLLDLTAAPCPRLNLRLPLLSPIHAWTVRQRRCFPI